MAKKKKIKKRMEDLTGWEAPVIINTISGKNYWLDRFCNINTEGEEGYKSLNVVNFWTHELDLSLESKMSQSFIFWKFLRKREVGVRYIGLEIDMENEENG